MKNLPVVHYCYPSCSLSSIAVTPINFRSFSKSIAALDAKNDQKGKGQTVKMALPVQSFLSSLQEDSSCVPFSFPTIIFLWRHLEQCFCIGILLFHIPSGNYHLLTSLIPSAMVRRPSLANWKVLCIEATNGQNRR